MEQSPSSEADSDSDNKIPCLLWNLETLLCSQKRRSPMPCVTFCDMLFLWSILASLLPNLQAGGPPLVGFLQLLIQYIHSYPPYLEAATSICNLRLYHALVMRKSLNMEVLFILILYL